jgi:hypothetical protein
VYSVRFIGDAAVRRYRPKHMRLPEAPKAPKGAVVLSSHGRGRPAVTKHTLAL